MFKSIGKFISNIFEDVIDVVDILPGISPEDMALGIIDWINNNQYE